MMRGGKGDEEIAAAVAAIWQKRGRPLLRDPHRGDGPRAQDRDVVHRRLGSRGIQARAHAQRTPRHLHRGRGRRDRRDVPTPIAGEHPLTLYVDKKEIVTLMTLGAAPEALALGFLRNQRLVQSVEEIASVQVDWDVNAVVVTTRTAARRPRGEDRQAHRHHRLRPGHGVRRPHGRHRVDPARRRHARGRVETLFGLLNAVRLHESIYKQAGAVHGCALAKGTEILTFVEDVGRHNAVDAIAGWMWLEDVDGADKIFYTTGRLTSEMVIKAAQMQHPGAGLALGPHQDGTRDREQGRHHDDRAGGGQALLAVHRRAPPRGRARAREGRQCLTAHGRADALPLRRRGDRRALSVALLSRTATARVAASRTAQVW